ncbi:MAG: hypothetical protein EBS05_26560 [Proteobacteria bacterium]|nr:hypothetical protein [Pseudomonadota bacterium]
MSPKTPMLNRSKVKQFTMTTAEKRAHKFTRVGSEFFVRCEVQLKNFIRDQVHRHPSVGKTIK